MRAVAGLVAVTVGGCLSAPPDPLWVQQRQGVLALPDPAKRAGVLANVCESAAHGGDAAAVKMLLTDLEDDPRHDDLAGRCAVALAAKDKANGRRIAKLIDDAGKRDAALAKVDALKETE